MLDILIGRWVLPSMTDPIQILSVLLLLTLSSVISAQIPSACGIVGIDGPAKSDPNTLSVAP